MHLCGEALHVVDPCVAVPDFGLDPHDEEQSARESEFVHHCASLAAGQALGFADEAVPIG